MWIFNSLISMDDYNYWDPAVLAWWDNCASHQVADDSTNSTPALAVLYNEIKWSDEELELVAPQSVNTSIHWSLISGTPRILQTNDTTSATTASPTTATTAAPTDGDDSSASSDGMSDSTLIGVVVGSVVGVVVLGFVGVSVMKGCMVRK